MTRERHVPGILAATFRPTRLDFCGLAVAIVAVAWPSWEGMGIAVVLACLLALASLVAAVVIATWALRSRHPDLRVATRIAVQAHLLAVGIAAIGLASVVASPLSDQRTFARAEQVIDRIEAYRRDHGSYPPSLERLAAADGQALPRGSAVWSYSADGRIFTLDVKLTSGHCYHSDYGAWLKG